MKNKTKSFILKGRQWIVNILSIKLSKRVTKIKSKKNVQSNVNANRDKEARTKSSQRPSGSAEIKE